MHNWASGQAEDLLQPLLRCCTCNLPLQWPLMAAAAATLRCCCCCLLIFDLNFDLKRRRPPTRHDKVISISWEALSTHAHTHTRVRRIQISQQHTHTHTRPPPRRGHVKVQIYIGLMVPGFDFWETATWRTHPAIHTLIHSFMGALTSTLTHTYTHTHTRWLACCLYANHCNAIFKLMFVRLFLMANAGRHAMRTHKVLPHLLSLPPSPCPIYPSTRGKSSQQRKVPALTLLFTFFWRFNYAKGEWRTENSCRFSSFVNENGKERGIEGKREKERERKREGKGSVSEQEIG